ncbi:unnamed protein product [Rodentolepis nana]|uniref:Transmembrane protein 150B n=1 Tax=Rodentolepis nana TaxID=102285 RepID=A0A0R3TY49_RODNA|nr:unnamed protein product [Rodentolepis nana]
MRRIVVSATSLLWMLFSTSSLAFIFISLFFSSGWLRRIENQDSQLWETNCLTTLNQLSPEPIIYSPPTLGPIFSCETACPGHSPARSILWTLGNNNGARVHCRTSLWGGGQKPAGSNAASWVGSIFLMIGSGVLLLAQWFVFLSPCKREVCGRSIFQVTGLLQCVSGTYFAFDFPDILHLKQIESEIF